MAVKTAEVIVIGGGVIGSSIAYHLAKHKVKVLLLDKRSAACGSSGACDGAVLLQSKKPGVHLNLALASIRRFQILAEELPYPIQFKNNGGMVIIKSEAEMDIMRRVAAEQNRHGVGVELLDVKQAREMEPALAEDIAGATFSSRDGQVNPIRLNLAFTLGAAGYGARIINGEEVRRIDVRNGRVQSVITAKGRYQGDVVVLAAGVWSPEIAKTAGLDLPIEPRRGQILVSEAAEKIIDRCMLTSTYIAAKFDPAIARQGHQGVSIDQTGKGNFLLGSTREFVGFDRRTTLTGIARIARCASEVIPRLSGLNVIRSFAGLRPYTPDGLPFIGRVEQVEGLVVAAGHEGDGITLSPITGALVSQLLRGLDPELPLDDFQCRRPAKRLN